MLMRKLIIAILICIPATGLSQISGVVMDKSSGYPVQYAAIRVEGWNKVFTADSNGRFKLNEEALNKTLIISAIGFNPEYVVASRTFMRIDLKTKVYWLPEITITSEKGKTDSLKNRFK